MASELRSFSGFPAWLRSFGASVGLSLALTATAMQLSYNLAGRGKGVKHRNYRSLALGKAGAEEWKAHLQKPASKGGMGAISLNYPDDMETEIEEAMSKPLPEADMNYAQEAWDDFHRMKGYLVRAPKRKACPEWSSPTEVWLLALLPKWRLNAPSGLGCEAIPEQWHQFRVKVVQLLTHIRRIKRVPVKWILNRGWQIGKSNGKMGIPGTRTMHGFDSLSKAFFSSALKRGAQGDEGWVPWTCPYWNHGYEAHKTRDDSVAVQDIVSYRLQKQGFSFLTESHDGTNAFQCSNVQCLNYVIDTLYRPSDRALVHQRVFYGACLIGIHGKELFMMPTTGTPYRGSHQQQENLLWDTPQAWKDIRPSYAQSHRASYCCLTLPLTRMSLFMWALLFLLMILVPRQ